MLFNLGLKGLTAAVAVFGVLTLAGCDYFLKRQGPPAQEQVEIKMGEIQCLRLIPKDMTAWLTDTLDAPGTQRAFRCLSDTLKHFQRFTRGSSVPDQYHSEELRSFLNEVLPQTHQVDEVFMGEVMKLKTVFLGGSASIMTKKEIEQARVLVTVLETEALNLRGLMRLLLFQAPKDTVETSALKTAQERFEKSVTNILRVSKPEASNYSFDDIKSLVEAADGYLGHNRILSQLLRWLPLTQKFKLLFLGDRTLAYSQRDWQDVLGWSARAYGLVLEFVYKVRHYNLNSASDMEKMISFGDRIFDLADDSPVLKERGYLSLEALDEVIAEGLASGIVKTTMPLPLLKESVRKALMLLIEGPGAQRREIFEVEDMTRRHLTTMRFEWNVFVLAQRRINRFFLEDNDRLLGAFIVGLDEAAMRTEVQSRARRPGEAGALLRTWNEWRELVAGEYPVVWDSTNRLALRKDAQNIELGFRGMTMSNLLRSFSRAILRGYGSGNTTNLWQFKMQEPQFSQFENDFREIGEEIQFLDRRAQKPAARTLQEANFFTFKGNGDTFLDARELFEELNILTSAGGMIANDLLTRAVAAGCAIDKVDVFGKRYLKKDCFHAMFRNIFADSFRSAPGLVKLQESLKGQEGEQEFYDNIAAVGKAPFSIEGLVEYGDLRTYATILYYIEILRIVYDTNEDRLLSPEEIDGAAPRFREFVASKSPFGNWMLQDTFFSCLVFEQHKPGFDWTTGNCVSTGWMGYDPVSPAVLLRVLAVLKADMQSNVEKMMQAQ